jgi:predicted dinucleotide-binding enzyme
VVKFALEQNGLSLRHASDGMRDDHEMVIAAVTQNGHALQYASKRLRSDWTIVEVAAATNPDALQYADDDVLFQRLEESRAEVVQNQMTQSKKISELRAALNKG